MHDLQTIIAMNNPRPVTPEVILQRAQDNLYLRTVLKTEADKLAAIPLVAAGKGRLIPLDDNNTVFAFELE